MNEQFEKWWEKNGCHPKASPEIWMGVVECAYEAAQPKWQPIELPREDKTVLVLLRVPLFDGKYHIRTGLPEMTKEATHWQPLPEPPKQ